MHRPCFGGDAVPCFGGAAVPCFGVPRCRASARCRVSACRAGAVLRRPVGAVLRRPVGAVLRLPVGAVLRRPAVPRSGALRCRAPAPCGAVLRRSPALRIEHWTPMRNALHFRVPPWTAARSEGVGLLPCPSVQIYCCCSWTMNWSRRVVNDAPLSALVKRSAKLSLVPTLCALVMDASRSCRTHA